jgi:hypothetical protein
MLTRKAFKSSKAFLSRPASALERLLVRGASRTSATRDLPPHRLPNSLPWSDCIRRKF